MNFVVSTISVGDVKDVQDQGGLKVSSDVYVNIQSKNRLDPYFVGIPLFRHYPIPKRNVLTEDYLQLIQCAYYDTGLVRGFDHDANFQMVGNRQTNRPNWSMGKGSLPVTHQ